MRGDTPYPGIGRRNRIAGILLLPLACGIGALVYVTRFTPEDRLTWGAEHVCEFHDRMISWPGDGVYCLKARMPANVAARRIRALSFPCAADEGNIPPPMFSWRHERYGAWWDPGTNFAGTHWDGEIGQEWYRMAKYKDGWLYYISALQ